MAVLPVWARADTIIEESRLLLRVCIKYCKSSAIDEGLKSMAIANGTRLPISEDDLLEKWKHLTILSDYIFCKVMQDEELLAGLVRLILPYLHFSKIGVHSQKSIEEGMDIHGVRFDIFATDDRGNTIVVEMQVQLAGATPKRFRYYSSLSDMQMLEKGMHYSRLKDAYIVIISPMDVFGRGRHIYTFTNRCHEEEGLEMGDGTMKVFLNANGTADDVHGGLKAFLDYVAGRTSDDAFVKKVDDAVKMAKANKSWRREYMTLMMRDLENQEIWLEEGRKEGRKDRDREKIEEMLRNGKMPEEIADFCKYPLSLVKSVQENMLVAQ